ncbi:hypothetical protein LEP1GSC108_0381 [Leptospira weilii str. UI 13098]|uniref:Uncharacterized protein n=1 Tax=Leptospira weilii str. UI 13098 TaxID=1088542 RepID=M6Q8J8_9LEPT|nr:hypothetical protein LEP1GSC108_0381 [Leptospira weilii str. UI 13098]
MFRLPLLCKAENEIKTRIMPYRQVVTNLCLDVAEEAV